MMNVENKSDFFYVWFYNIFIFEQSCDMAGCEVWYKREFPLFSGQRFS